VGIVRWWVVVLMNWRWTMELAGKTVWRKISKLGLGEGQGMSVFAAARSNYCRASR
jgi:hypothetical protein